MKEINPGWMKDKTREPCAVCDRPTLYRWDSGQYGGHGVVPLCGRCANKTVGKVLDVLDAKYGQRR